MEGTQKKEKVKRVKNKKKLKSRLKKMLSKAFGVERIDYIAMMIVVALLFGLLVGYYVTI